MAYVGGDLDAEIDGGFGMVLLKALYELGGLLLFLLKTMRTKSPFLMRNV